MKGRRAGLGRGLAALIPTDSPASEASPSAPGNSIASGAPRGNAAGSPGGAAELAAISSEELEALAPVPGARFREVPVGQIAPNPRQPRQVFEEEAFEELKASISQVGLLQPIVVREIAQEQYELVMGERRWRAATALGLEKIPAIIRDTRNDQMLRDALLENIHRADLNPLEEAAAYQQLLDEFGVT
ncbi:MAG: ParB/RepB/Spo0J family partition protein, partial [Micromonosporaceae bacterium]